MRAAQGTAAASPAGPEPGVVLICRCAFGGRLDVVGTENILLLSDAASVDDEPLYDGNVPRVGASSVVVPLELPLRTPTGEWRVRFRGSVAVGATREIWSGDLTFPSGRAVATDWSMEPGPTYDVHPGLYWVRVAAADGWLDVSMTRAE